MLLIIAEKHDQMKDYVNALRGHATTRDLNRYVTQIKGSSVLPDYPDIRVTYLQGHLYELYEPAEYDKKWEKWDLHTLPIFPKQMKMHLKRGFGKRRKIIADQIQECDDLWLASDSDVEGENLGYIFLSHNHGLSKLDGRVWQNSQTKEGLIKAFHHIRRPQETIGNAHSGYSRMLADWYIGMNYSRLLSILLHDKGYQGVYSVGRVQTPTLHLINERRQQRAHFQDSSVYEVNAVDDQGLKFSTAKEDAFSTPEQAQRFIQTVQEQPLNVTRIQQAQKHQSAPRLYKTGKVQGHLVQRCHITAKEALNDVLEHMYNTLNIISYPRTDCNLLTKDDYRELKKHLPQYARCYEGITGKTVRPYLTNLTPDKKHVDFSGKKVQKVGHHALTPDKPISSAEYRKLRAPEKIAYRYILASVLAMFMPEYEYRDYEIQAQNDLSFHAHHTEPLNRENWKLIYPSKDNSSPDLDLSRYQEGSSVAITKYLPHEIKAKPPRAITESNLVASVMPQYHLGTQATRGDIIDNLSHRKIITIAKKANKREHQVKGEFIPTDRGIILLEAMRDTNLLDLAQVQSWEDRMTAIAQGDEKVAGFLKGIKEAIYQDIRKLPQEDRNFSIEPDRKPSDIEDKRVDTLDIRCPKCRQGHLEHLTMTKDRKPLDFYSCDNSRCNFMAASHFAGLSITPHVLKTILTGRFPEHDFTSKKGNKFRGKLVYRQGKIQLQFDDSEPAGDDTGITCPKCRKGHLELIHYHKSGQDKALYVCTNSECKFLVPTAWAGMHITTDTLQEIIHGNFPEHEFTSKRGKKFTAQLVYQNGKILMKFNDKHRGPRGKSIGMTCPKCRQGSIQRITYQKHGKQHHLYVCSNKHCKFIAPAKLAGLNITPDILKQTIRGTLDEQEFTSKKGKPFTAKLIYQQGRIEMDFD